MPSLHYMNPPPHPFWDFINGIEDHPFFNAYGGPNRADGRGDMNDNTQQPQAETAAATAATNEKPNDKQATVEDPPEVDPSNIRPNVTIPQEVRGFPFRGRGRFGAAFEGGEENRRGHGCRRRGDRQPGSGPGAAWGPPPFGFGGHPFFGRGGPHGHHGGPPHHHGPPRGGRRSSPGHHGPPAGPHGFDLGQFLNNLGERLGVDLNTAAENMGISNLKTRNNNGEADFEPRADIFDTTTNYTIHLSLPGAKKEDVGVDWDGEHSVLRVAGVVHRPGVDEEMLTKLIVNGRKRENGVFEKAIRLGTKHDPANIDVSGIGAKMTDGVLVITVPKIETEHKKREVPIDGSTSTSPIRDNEKSLLFDADEEMYDAPTHGTTATSASQEDTAKKTADLDDFAEKPYEKDVEAEDNRSETAGCEELPRYTAGEPVHEDSDWEKYSDEEGEYVKINVN